MNSLQLINAKLRKIDFKDSSKLELDELSLNKAKHILNSFSIQNLIKKMQNDNYINNIDYSNISEINDIISTASKDLIELKQEIDIIEFRKKGDIFNFKKLRKIFKIKKLYNSFPNFDFDKYEELMKNPLLEINNYAGETIKYAPFLVKKLNIAINQMIFDEMDIRIINVGKEGSGKSCFASQQLLYIYTFCKEVGLITYDYDVKNLFYSSLGKMLQDQDNQKDDDLFRLFCLDEGYELNRQNFREENSKVYKDSMRADRKMQRIEILNLPQIGELESSITQTRTNFIFYADMDSDVETGTLKKGFINMYIIPRGKYIYSPYQRRNIAYSEIINDISRVLKDKNDSYKGLPKTCIIARFDFAGVWGFNKQAYDKYIKKENKKRRLTGDIKTTDYIGYILFKKLPKMSLWGTFDMKDKSDKKMYHTIQKWLKNGIERRYIENPELLSKYERLYGE